MTKITITKSEKYILAFEVSGHTGFADEGSDIVCSAISTATQMAVCVIKEVLKLDAFVEISEGYLKCKLSAKDLRNDAAQAILVAMQKTLQEIVKEYGKFVKMEVKRDEI